MEFLSRPTPQRHAIPEHAHQLYTLLSDDLQWLYVKWKIFNQIFATEENVDLLNKHTRFAAYVIQWLFLDDMTVGISRITDQKEYKKNKRASIDQLVYKLDLETRPLLKDQLEPALQSMNEKCSPIRSLRNLKTVHADLETALDQPLVPIPEISRLMIIEALDSIAKVLNTIQHYLDESHLLYEHVAIREDGRSLMEIINLGIKAYEDSQG